MIYFIGAGPGAADLITVKGKELLEKCDLCIYAGSLVNPDLLKYCKPECVIMNSAHMTLEEVIAAMVPAAQAGKLVVRLHTGDPSVYGAHREQIDLLLLSIRLSRCTSRPIFALASLFVLLIGFISNL